MVEKNLSNGFPLWPKDQNENLDLPLLWKVIQSRRWFIITVTAITLTIALIYVLSLPNVYTASSKILIERGVGQSAFENPEIMKTSSEYGEVYYQTRAEVLKSRHILEQVVDQLNLVEKYHVKTKEGAVGLLNREVAVKIIRNTQILELSVTDPNPEMAAKVANAVSENFIKESWRERLFISEQVLKWFPEEGKKLEENSAVNQLKNLDNEDAIMSLPSISRDPVISSIKQDRLRVDTEIKELSRRYTNEHPKMKELQARASYLESEMNAQIEKVIHGLKAGLVGEFGISNVKVIENAVVPTNRSGPRRFKTIFLATFLGFFGSVFFVFLLYHLDQNIKSEKDFQKIPITFLGYLSLIGSSNATAEHAVSLNLPELMSSEAKLNDEMTNIRTSVLFSMPAERNKLIMCTSAIPEEGKTTITSLLGLSLAEMGAKVLLVDADMRKPALHRVFGLENKSGLSDCLVGSAQPKDVIQIVDKFPTLHVMTAGKKTPNPAVLLSSITVDRLLGELKSEYSRIIFDVPPSLHIADGLIMTGKVHGTILVFEAGKVHQNVGKKMVEKITAANGVIIGGIINRADYKKLDYPYYQYYRQYTKYYHKSEPAGMH